MQREVACVAPQAVLSPNARVKPRGAPSPQVPHLAEKNARTSDKRRDPSPSRSPENQRKAAWATASKLRTCIDFPLKSSKGVFPHPPDTRPRTTRKPRLMGECPLGGRHGPPPGSHLFGRSRPLPLESREGAIETSYLPRAHTWRRKAPQASPEPPPAVRCCARIWKASTPS